MLSKHNQAESELEFALLLLCYICKIELSYLVTKNDVDAAHEAAVQAAITHMLIGD